MNDLFLGWDVGAWNCDQNRKSRDALCAIEVRESGPVVVGRPWRGNVRDLLVAEGDALIAALMKLLEVAIDDRHHLTIAIDTPLGWPTRMLDLVRNGSIVVEVPPEADENPYLFRKQDLALFTQKHRPLSMVRDMIGSQSTKGIHFLQRARLKPTAGVWSRDSTVALETYPAAAVKDAEVKQLTDDVFGRLPGREKQNAAWLADVRDAVTCALVASLHRNRLDRLAPPGADADPGEGWIWLPAPATPTA